MDSEDFMLLISDYYDVLEKVINIKVELFDYIELFSVIN